MNTLQACAANKKDIPAYMVSIARLREPAEEHFPIGFPPDYVAVVVDLFVRDILSVSLRTKGEFHVYIKLKDYTLSNIPWLPFTLALHAITQSTTCCVFFEGIAPDEYSKIVDSYRPYSPLNCLKNLVAYLCTPKGDRPKECLNSFLTAFIFRLKKESWACIKTRPRLKEAILNGLSILIRHITTGYHMCILHTHSTTCRYAT